MGIVAGMIDAIYFGVCFAGRQARVVRLMNIP